MANQVLVLTPEDIALLQRVGSPVFVSLGSLNDGKSLELELTGELCPRRVRGVLEYVGALETSRDLLLGRCTREIDFLGLEHLFERDVLSGNIVPSLWRFDVALQAAAPGIWLQCRKDAHDRLNRWKHRILASRERLEPFGPEVLASMQPEPVDVASGLCAFIRSSAGKSGKSAIDFHALERSIGELPRGLPWARDGRSGIVVAGGAIGSWLRKRPLRDIDIFVVLSSSQSPQDQAAPEMHGIIHATIEAIARHHGGCHIISKGRILDVVAYNAALTYQIICVAYASIAQVVAGFDIDCCRVAFTMRLNSRPTPELLAHPTALRAFKNGWNLFDARTLSTTALFRYAKKFEAGMDILVPGISQDVLDQRLGVLKQVVSSMSRGDYCQRRSIAPTIDGLLLAITMGSVGLVLMNRQEEPSDYDYAAGRQRAWTYFTEVTQSCLTHRHCPGIAFSSGTRVFAHRSSFELRLNSASKRTLWIDPCFEPNRDSKGAFTGAFNPVQSDIYSTTF
jgi:hypothetical protein